MTITRQEAKAAGLTRYFSGKPCPQGHVSERMTSNTDCVACMRDRSKRYYAIKPDKVLAAQRRRYEANPEIFRERGKRNYWANPVKTRVAHALCRTKGVPGTFTEADIIQKMEQQNFLCVCGANLREEWEIDHIVALSRGGSNWPENIQLLCRPCNCSKRDKTMEEWSGRAA